MECLNTTVLVREIKHAKAVVDGKLYDTEKSEFLSQADNGRTLWVTNKGNYFSCKAFPDEYTSPKNGRIEQHYDTCHYDIRPETKEYAISNLGRYNVEKYIELFGQPEEA